MKKVNVMIIILFIFVLYFWNILYAVAAHSEKMDTYMFKVMLKGKLRPSHEMILSMNNSEYKIPLPKGSSELNKNEYLVPVQFFQMYKKNLAKTQWNFVEQTGTSIWVKDEKGNNFYISVRPFTGAYLIVKYSSN